MTESLFQRFGGLLLPADEAQVTDTLVGVCDPGHDVLIGLFKQAIISELGAAFNVARAGTTLSTSTVVQHDIPHRLSSQNVRDEKMAWPLLAVYPTEDPATYEEHNLNVDRVTQQWGVDYVLGTLGIDEQRKLNSILRAIPKVIALTIKMRGHPDYQSGALQFGDDAGKFCSIRLVSHRIGQMQFAGGEDDSPVYHGVICRIETTETDDFREGYATDLEGMSVSVGVGGNDGILPNVIEANTDAIP